MDHTHHPYQFSPEWVGSAWAELENNIPWTIHITHFSSAQNGWVQPGLNSSSAWAELENNIPWTIHITHISSAQNGWVQPGLNSKITSHGPYTSPISVQ